MEWKWSENRQNTSVEEQRQRCSAARKKDYQLQECLGICVGPGRATQQNKIPVIEILSVAWDNGDRAERDRERER